MEILITDQTTRISVTIASTRVEIPKNVSSKYYPNNSKIALRDDIQDFPGDQRLLYLQILIMFQTSDKSCVSWRAWCAKP